MANCNEDVRKPLDFHNNVRVILSEFVSCCGTVLLITLCLYSYSQLVSKHFNRAVHYMKFAAGAYGASAYIHHKGFLCGCLKLTGCFW